MYVSKLTHRRRRFHCIAQCRACHNKLSTLAFHSNTDVVTLTRMWSLPVRTSTSRLASAHPQRPISHPEPLRPHIWPLLAASMSVLLDWGVGLLPYAHQGIRLRTATDRVYTRTRTQHNTAASICAVHLPNSHLHATIQMAPAATEGPSPTPGNQTTPTE